MRGKDLLMTALLAAACGCGESAERPEPVALDKVPPAAMAAATKALPGIKFERAQKIWVNGQEAYEIRGKEKGGKIREAEVTAAGELIEVE
jgi:hypothetical protein